MARPLKTKVKLKRVVGVRVDDATYAGWKERAADAGVPIGEWARNRIIQGKAVRQSRRRELPAADPKLLAAIARVGNNVNQIARAGNQGRFPERMQLLEQLIAIERALYNLVPPA